MGVVRPCCETHQDGGCILQQRFLLRSASEIRTRDDFIPVIVQLRLAESVSYIVCLAA